MTELQAEQAAVVPRTEVGSQRSRYRDPLLLSTRKRCWSSFL